MKKKQLKLNKQLTTVTPVSKIVAAIIFIALPFIGFYLGIQYQESVQADDSTPIAVIGK